MPPPTPLLNNNSTKRHIKWVDTAKSIGVFLVIWGHILPKDLFMVRIIYSFHMPMFFILSGYVMREDNLSLSGYLKFKYHRILKPALILYISTLPIYFLLLDYSQNDIYSILDRIFYLSGICAYNAPVWFFFCMFEVLIISKLLDIVNASKLKLLIIISTSLVITFFFYHYKYSVFSFLGFNKCVLAFTFLTIGHLCRRLIHRISSDKYMLFGIFAFAIWIITLFLCDEKVNMHSFKLGNMWLFILSGITGSIFSFFICKIIENVAFIRSYARWTIFIICTHFVILTFYSFAIERYIKDFSYITLLSGILALLIMMIYKPICMWVDRNIPVLMGRILR